MSEGSVIRVFLLDDHEIVRRGLRELLESEADLDIVGEASSAAEALRRIPALRPDVAVLDARLGDGSGVDVCREVRSQLPQTAVLILTSFADDDALFAAVMAGAAGYVLKDVHGDDLIGAIRRVAEGQSLLDPSATATMLNRMRGGERPDTLLSTLTAQERRVLELIGEGLTNRQIAAQMFLSEKTVKNYVSVIFSKLGLERRTQAAVFASKLTD